MEERRESGPVPLTNQTSVERVSDRDLVVMRTFNAPVGVVFEAWTKPDLFKQWWAPRSMGVPLLSCEMDARTGGRYRLEFGHDASQSMEFFGRYTEVVPCSRLVWTNEEGGDGAVTAVSFEEVGSGWTRVTLHERYPSKEALDEAAAGTADCTPEQFEQLDDVLLTLHASMERG